MALIGHATIVETESQECIETFAQFARSCSPTHLIRGEQEKVESFWNYYSDDEHDARLICREFLLTRQAIPTNVDVVPGLRQATLADLEMIVTVNASMAARKAAPIHWRRTAPVFASALRAGFVRDAAGS